MAKTLPETVSQLIFANRWWRKLKAQGQPEFFDLQAKGQEPRFMFIACSDSRVPPNVITNSELGSIFEVRNVANLVVPDQESMLSAVCYVVKYLEKVKHIIICGHHGCGGIASGYEYAAQGKAFEEELIPRLDRLAKIYHNHRDELEAIPDMKERLERFVELNVMQQAENMAKLPRIVKAGKHAPMIHPLVYEVGTGYIKFLSEDEQGKAALLKELTMLSIQQEVERLHKQAESYNPYHFIGAKLKADKIDKALNEAMAQDADLVSLCQQSDSALHQALNEPRLCRYSFSWRQGFFRKDSRALQEVLEDSQTFQRSVR